VPAAVKVLQKYLKVGERVWHTHCHQQQQQCRSPPRPFIFESAAAAALHCVPTSKVPTLCTGKCRHVDHRPVLRIGKLFDVKMPVTGVSCAAVAAVCCCVRCCVLQAPLPPPRL
jgi:hypothetical protein